MAEEFNGIIIRFNKGVNTNGMVNTYRAIIRVLAKFHLASFDSITLTRKDELIASHTVNFENMEAFYKADHEEQMRYSAAQNPPSEHPIPEETVQ